MPTINRPIRVAALLLCFVCSLQTASSLANSFATEDCYELIGVKKAEPNFRDKVQDRGLALILGATTEFHGTTDRQKQERLKALIERYKKCMKTLLHEGDVKFLFDQQSGQLRQRKVHANSRERVQQWLRTLSSKINLASYIQDAVYDFSDETDPANIHELLIDSAAQEALAIYIEAMLRAHYDLNSTAQTTAFGVPTTRDNLSQLSTPEAKIASFVREIRASLAESFPVRVKAPHPRLSAYSLDWANLRKIMRRTLPDDFDAQLNFLLLLLSKQAGHSLHKNDGQVLAALSALALGYYGHLPVFKDVEGSAPYLDRPAFAAIRATFTPEILLSFFDDATNAAYFAEFITEGGFEFDKGDLRALVNNIIQVYVHQATMGIDPTSPGNANRRDLAYIRIAFAFITSEKWHELRGLYIDPKLGDLHFEQISQIIERNPTLWLQIARTIHQNATPPPDEKSKSRLARWVQTLASTAFVIKKPSTYRFDKASDYRFELIRIAERAMAKHRNRVGKQRAMGMPLEEATLPSDPAIPYVPPAPDPSAAPELIIGEGVLPDWEDADYDMVRQCGGLFPAAPRARAKAQKP